MAMVQISPRGSYVEAQRFSWDMWYPGIPPTEKTWTNEPGLHVHLVPDDTDSVESVIVNAVSSVGAAIGGAFGAFAGVVPQLLEHFTNNGDGSLDIFTSQHGIQIGEMTAADPTAWLGPLWTPVAAALDALGSLENARAEAPGEEPHGKLTAKEPLAV